MGLTRRLIPRHPVDPVDPVDPADPLDSVDPVDPVDPAIGSTGVEDALATESDGASSSATNKKARLSGT